MYIYNNNNINNNNNNNNNNLLEDIRRLFCFLVYYIGIHVSTKGLQINIAYFLLFTPVKYIYIVLIINIIIPNNILNIYK